MFWKYLKRQDKKICKLHFNGLAVKLSGDNEQSLVSEEKSRRRKKWKRKSSIRVTLYIARFHRIKTAKQAKKNLIITCLNWKWYGDIKGAGTSKFSFIIIGSSILHKNQLLKLLISKTTTLDMNKIRNMYGIYVRVWQDKIFYPDVKLFIGPCLFHTTYFTYGRWLLIICIYVSSSLALIWW